MSKNKIVTWEMFKKYHDFHMGKYGAAVHDSCAALYVTNPEIFKMEDAKIAIKYYKKHVWWELKLSQIKTKFWR